MTDVRLIYWIAALIEGEGYPCFNGTARLKITMTDKDVVERASQILKSPSVREYRRDAEGYKPAYVTEVVGRRAVEWMMTLYSLMGIRRQEQFRKVILEWKGRLPYRNPYGVPCTINGLRNPEYNRRYNKEPSLARKRKK